MDTNTWTRWEHARTHTVDYLELNDYVGNATFYRAPLKKGMPMVRADET